MKWWARAYAGIEIIVVVVVVWLLITGGWRHWWAWLGSTLIVAMVCVVHAYLVAGFELTENWEPPTGRDADRFARWKAAVREHSKADHQGNTE